MASYTESPPKLCSIVRISRHDVIWLLAKFNCQCRNDDQGPGPCMSLAKQRRKGLVVKFHQDRNAV
jgi:hypothetical protein